MGYIVFSTLPMFGRVVNKTRLIATLTQVQCIGFYRKPQHIALVQRQQKTEEAVRTFLIIGKLCRFANRIMLGVTSVKKKNYKPYKELLTGPEISQIEKTFDLFDLDGSGRITYEEFKELMEKFGATMDEVKLSKMIALIDIDNNGNVNKEEFLQ